MVVNSNDGTKKLVMLQKICVQLGIMLNTRSFILNSAFTLEGDGRLLEATL